MTKVTFKIEKPTTRGERTPFAYFPEIMWNRYCPNERACYAHLGRHGACAVDYARECRLAKYEEYKPLYDELVRIGYDDLVVTNGDFRTENAAPDARRRKPNQPNRKAINRKRGKTNDDLYRAASK